MKKFFVILALVLISLLCSCGSKKNADDNEAGMNDRLLINVFYKAHDKIDCQDKLVNIIDDKYDVIKQDCRSYEEELELFKSNYDIGSDIVMPVDIDDIYVCTIIIENVENRQEAEEIVEYVYSIENVNKVDYTYKYVGSY